MCSPRRKRGSSPIPARRLDSRLRGNDVSLGPPRRQGVPVLARHIAWVTARAGMTCSPVVDPRGDGEEAHAIIPAAMPGLGAEGFRGIFLYLSAAFGAFLVALWLSLVFWTWRDIRARSQDRFLRLLAPLLVLLLNLPGVIVYLILRPRLTLEEEYERALEEEALLALWTAARAPVEPVSVLRDAGSACQERSPGRRSLSGRDLNLHQPSG